jgi:hypothetical protein
MPQSASAKSAPVSTPNAAFWTVVDTRKRASDIGSRTPAAWSASARDAPSARPIVAQPTPHVRAIPSTPRSRRFTMPILQVASVA